MWQGSPSVRKLNRDARQQLTQQDNGKSFADGRFSLEAVSPEWEQWARSLPVDNGGITGPIQNEDGSFVPMVGFDDLGDDGGLG
jgi:hypothetical protein